MATITFSYNWNNKLNCNFFTTIRKPNKLYIKGCQYLITYSKTQAPGAVKNPATPLFIAQLLHVQDMSLADIPESWCMLDFGYSKAEFIEIISKMYKLEGSAREKTVFSVLFFKRSLPLKEQPVIKTY